MPKKGFTNNPNGRPKGKPNRTTTELRLLFQYFLEQNLGKLQSDFDKLTPGDRLAFILRLIPHILPPPVDNDNWLDFTIDQEKTNELLQYFDELQQQSEQPPTPIIKVLGKG